MGCLFCDIAAGVTPSKKVYENEHVFCFEDINPQSPIHTLVIPKLHIERIDDLRTSDRALVGELFLAVGEVARMKGLGTGYRLIVNNGPAGGQVVWHLHIHLLAGRDTMGPMIAK